MTSNTMQRIFVVHGEDASNVNAYASIESFLATYDVDYRATEEGAELTTRYREAAQAAQENPGEPYDIGDGDFILYISIR